jgi:hypothetical protein
MIIACQQTPDVGPLAPCCIPPRVCVWKQSQISAWLCLLCNCKPTTLCALCQINSPVIAVNILTDVSTGFHCPCSPPITFNDAIESMNVQTVQLLFMTIASNQLRSLVLITRCFKGVKDVRGFSFGCGVRCSSCLRTVATWRITSNCLPPLELELWMMERFLLANLPFPVL